MFKFFKRVQVSQLEAWNKLRFSTISRKRQRIIALDILRGILLITLIANHMPWTPSFFSFVTGRSELFASAAEGFFVVSGVLVGYIYGQKIIGSPRQTFRKIWKRALVLYFLSVGGTLFFTLIAITLPHNFVGIETWTGSLKSFFLNTFTLRYAYGWTDFLNRYSLFMFVAPFALWLVSRQKAWVVLASSIFLWLILGTNAYFMPFSAWQLIFMFGLVLGFYLPEIEGRVTHISSRKRMLVFRAIVSLAITTYVVSVWWSVVIPYILSSFNTLLPQGLLSFLKILETTRNEIWEPWFSKSSLGIGRLFFGTVWFIALYLMIRVYEDKVVFWRLGKAIEYLGKHSLFVYVSHGIVIVLVNILLSPPPGYTNILLNTLIVGLILKLVFEIAWRRELFDQIISRTRKRINREDF